MLTEGLCTAGVNVHLLNNVWSFDALNSPSSLLAAIADDTQHTLFIHVSAG